MALSDYYATLQQNIQAGATPAPSVTQPSGTQMVTQSLQDILNPNSTYIQNARQRGVEMAATRGGVNSSIAAGASERAAIEAAAPLATAAVNIDVQRQQAVTEDWLNQQNFNRTFQGSLAMLPVQSSFGMLEAIQQYALEDPELYTPDVVSGYSNFFNQNMKNVLDSYFG
jgi:hypothetical protein